MKAIKYDRILVGHAMTLVLAFFLSSFLIAEEKLVIGVTSGVTGTTAGIWADCTTFPDKVTIPYLSKALKSELGSKATGKIYAYADAWTVLCVPGFKDVSSKLGLIALLEAQSYRGGDAVFCACQVTYLKGADVSTDFMHAQVREGLLLIKQARDLGG